MCLLQAQAACNKRIGGWACRSHYVWNICVYFNNTKFTEILWNDGVFEFPKEHQRCSIEYTDFNTIEIMCLRQAQAPRWEVRMCLRQAQAPCNGIIGGWACRSHNFKKFFFIFNFLYKWNSRKAIGWWERGNVLGLPTQKPLLQRDKRIFDLNF